MLRTPHWLAFFTRSSLSLLLLYAKGCRMAQGLTFNRMHSTDQSLMTTRSPRCRLENARSTFPQTDGTVVPHLILVA